MQLTLFPEPAERPLAIQRTDGSFVVGPPGYSYEQIIHNCPDYADGKRGFMELRPRTGMVPGMTFVPA